MTDADVITQSFEVAAERCEDLTPLVYERLFRLRPDLEAHFWREPKRQIQGEMLARVIEAVFDFIGARRYADAMIRCEVVTHEGYEVPREAFGLFFVALAEALEVASGPAWTPAMGEAWRGLVDELTAYAATA